MRRAFAVLAALAVLAAAERARAQPAVTGRASSSSSSSPLGDVPPWFIPEGEPMKSVALEANLPGLAIGLFSATLEYMIGVHHALVVSPQYTYAIPGVSDEITGGSVEAGYRYYAGVHGPEGWFLGGAFTYGAYRYIHTVAVETPQDHADDTSYGAIGGAVDGGYQILLYQHMVIGAGVGVAYRHFDTQPIYETQSHAHTDLVYGSGIRPRLLVSFGGAL